MFITPTEFDVRYGKAVKEALLRHCDIDEILVLEMDELAFEGVLTTSAITIATKRSSPSGKFRLVEGRLSERVERSREVSLLAEIATASLPWTPFPFLEGGANHSTARGSHCETRRLLPCPTRHRDR